MKTCDNARVIINTQCNFKCSYCCNKIPEIQKSFKMTTFDEFVKMGYDIVNITGGEPLLVPEKLCDLILQLKTNKRATKIYLYTNGTFPHEVEWYAHNIEGVNIGYHGDFSQVVIANYVYLGYGIPVRVHAQENTLDKDQELELIKAGAMIQYWKMNECDKTQEDRWII